MSLDNFLKQAFCWVAIIAIVLVSVGFSIVCLIVSPKTTLLVWFFMWVFRRAQSCKC